MHAIAVDHRDFEITVVWRDRNVFPYWSIFHVYRPAIGFASQFMRLDLVHLVVRDIGRPPAFHASLGSARIGLPNGYLNSSRDVSNEMQAIDRPVRRPWTLLRLSSLPAPRR
jgi:hypothetical protein